MDPCVCSTQKYQTSFANQIDSIVKHLDINTVFCRIEKLLTFKWNVN